MKFTVEMMRDGKAVQRAEVQAGSDVEAAKVGGPVKVPLGRSRPRANGYARQNATLTTKDHDSWTRFSNPERTALMPAT